MYVFDLTNLQSFENVKNKWMKLVKQHVTDDSHSVCIIGNKVDLRKAREVSFMEASKLAQKYN